MSGTLNIGYYDESWGTYELKGGELYAKNEYIGRRGTGNFIQSAGTHTVTESLILGWYRLYSPVGTYEMSNGNLSASTECVGYESEGTFTQTGGSHNVTNDLTLAAFSGSQGTYKLLGGTLTVGGNIIRGLGTSQFIIAGGTLKVLSDQIFTADALRLGEDEGDSSTFQLQSGTLQVADATIGNHGAGTFELNGGTLEVTRNLYLGYDSGSDGRYVLTGGALKVKNCIAGRSGFGTVEFTAPGALFHVSNLLRFAWRGRLVAVPGAQIHMTGSAFENRSKDPAAMAGLANLELIFEGGPADLDPFEVASAVGGGFDLNFALGTLTVGGADVGRVQLVDLFDNGNRGTFGAECLFAHLVAIEPGSTLDLNGLRLYVEGDVESFLDGWVAEGRLLDGTGVVLNAFYDSGKDWTVVPEPATLALLALGAAALIRLRRRPADL